MNGVSIYAIVGAAIVGFILLFKIGRFTLDRKKLGKKLYRFDRDSQRMNSFMLILRVVIGLAVLILYIIIRGTEFSWLACAFVAVMSVMLGTFAFPLLTSNTDFGIYDRGVVTQYGIALYENCSGYNLDRNPQRGVYLLTLINKIPLLTNYMLIVPAQEVAQVRNIMSRKLTATKGNALGLFPRK